MYAIALTLAKEMREYPGGLQALANSVLKGAEALRPMRWPAERLDTLGGYLTYHNVTLTTFFLCIYAAVQGARAIRGAEDRHSLEVVLATGWSRRAVVRDRAVGFLATLLLICAGLGLGVAVSIAAAGAPDFGGSLITMFVSGLAAMVAFALGMLVSQLTGSARTASGITSVLLTVLYVGTNVWDEIGPLGLVRYVSPFYYANFSRALVPGYGLDVPSALALVVMAAVLLGLAAWAFERRDYASPLWARRARRGERAAPPPGRLSQAMAGSIWTSILVRTRLGLLAWTLSAASLMALMILLMPAVMDVWGVFDDMLGIAAGTGFSREAQYLAFTGELVVPVLAAFVVAQASGWVADLAEGRTEVILAAPVSWARLVWQRLLALVVGVAVITVGGLAALVVGGIAVDAELDAAGLARLAVVSVLLGWALGAVAALFVAVLRTGTAVTVMAVYLGATYLVSYLVPMLDWPEWLNRLSVFWAFGHPYLEWPVAGMVVLLVLAVPGSLAAAALAERTPKVA